MAIKFVIEGNGECMMYMELSIESFIPGVT